MPRARDHQYYVYIMANRSRQPYVGVTGDLERRVYEHKHNLTGGFTGRYLHTMLVYYEPTADVHAALSREKQLKGWRNSKKVALIESVNPGWADLAKDWYE